MKGRAKLRSNPNKQLRSLPETEYYGVCLPSSSVTEEYHAKAYIRPLQQHRHHRSGSPVAIFNDGSVDSCIICMDRRGDMTLLPCHHTSICAECAERLQTCPLCRSKISLIR